MAIRRSLSANAASEGSIGVGGGTAPLSDERGRHLSSVDDECDRAEPADVSCRDCGEFGAVGSCL